MVRVGVIGVGMQGRHHARIYSELTDSNLVVVVDKDLKRAREIGKKYGVEYCQEYEKLYGKVDAVSITVPTTLHKRVATDFLNKGIHCLVEKPIASSLDEAIEIITAAEKNDVKLMIGHVERFNPVVKKLKEMISEGVLGKLIIISTRRVGPFVQRIRDVGIIIDSATHDIDIARYLIGGEPTNVYAKSGKVKHEKEDHAIVVLDFGDIVASLEVNWFTPHKVRSLVATGTKAIAYLDYIKQNLEVYSPEQKIVPRIEKEEPLKLELGHFLECIQDNKEPLVDWREGLNVLEIALRAQTMSRDLRCIKFGPLL